MIYKLTLFLSVLIFSLQICILGSKIDFDNKKACAYEPQLELWNGEVPHFFTHCLIAFPELAFCESNNLKKTYQNDCITVAEFNNILEQLYNNNYSLVDISKTYSTKNGEAKRNPFLFPKNKKPFILSFDDVVYDSRKTGRGMVDKIILENDLIKTKTNYNGQIIISNKNEFIPILESFIKQHPDFSFENARGIINLTGFAGILGYRTQNDSKNKTQERKDALRVIKKLKSFGWKFASHTYAHAHQNKLDLQKLKNDLQKWRDEVGSLVGKTDLYVYPYGEWSIKDTDKILLQQKFGFNLFLGVGIYDYYTHNGKNLHQDRKPLDGYSLVHRKDFYSKYFDTKKALDCIRIQA